MSHLVQMAGLTVHNFVSAATGLAMAFALVRAFTRSESHDDRQLLGRSHPRRPLPAAADLDRRSRSSWWRPASRRRCWARSRRRRSKAPSRCIVDRPGRQPGGHQGTRHQRRRLLQRQFGPSVREPERLDRRCCEIWSLAGHPGRDRHRLRPAGRQLQGGPRAAGHHGHRPARRRRRRSMRPRPSATRCSTALGVDGAAGNLEGKELRFGQALTALFSAGTTGTSTGAVVAMHDSFTPLGGLVPMFNMLLGCITPGGVGAGPLRHPGRRRDHGLRRRPDGRPHARISRQEDRDPRDEARDAGGAASTRCWCSASRAPR